MMNLFGDEEPAAARGSFQPKPEGVIRGPQSSLATQGQDVVSGSSEAPSEAQEAAPAPPAGVVRCSTKELLEALGVRDHALRYAIKRGRLDGTWTIAESGAYRWDKEAAVTRWETTSRTGRGVRQPPPTPAQLAAATDITNAAAAATSIDEIELLLSPERLQFLDLQGATRVQKILQAKLLKLEYDQAAGDLVLKAQVTKEAFEEAKRVRQALAAIPSRMRSHGLDASLARTLETELERATEGLAR
jgi:hypothetical protein